MKKILLILAIVLFAVQAWGATYTCGTGGTYPTISAAFSAVDGTPDDVFQLVSNISDNVTWNFENEGTPGHPISVDLNGYTIDASGNDYAFYLNGRDNCTITGPGTITGAKLYPIYAIACDNFIVLNLTINNFGASAIVNHSGVRILNNSDNFLVDNVEIYLGTGIGAINNGIDIGSAVGEQTTGTIKNCYIHDISGSTYGQGIKVVMEDFSVDSVTVSGCIIDNITGYGITFGEGGKLTISNNLIRNVTRYGYYGASTAGEETRQSYIKNNIFAGSMDMNMGIDNRYETYAGDYNCYTTNVATAMFRDIENSTVKTFSEWKTLQTDQDTHSITTNPLTTPSGKLYSNSPCIDTGSVIPEINDGGETDKWGNAADTNFCPNTASLFGPGWSDTGDYEWTCDGSQSAVSGVKFTSILSALKAYSISYTISSYSAGNIQIRLGDVAGSDDSRSADGTYTYNYTPVNDLSVYLIADADFEGVVTINSIVEAPNMGAYAGTGDIHKTMLLNPYHSGVRIGD